MSVLYLSLGLNVGEMSEGLIVIWLLGPRNTVGIHNPLLPAQLGFFVQPDTGRRPVDRCRNKMSLLYLSLGLNVGEMSEGLIVIWLLGPRVAFGTRSAYTIHRCPHNEGFRTTRHWNTSGRPVQELNVCTVSFSWVECRRNI